MPLTGTESVYSAALRAAMLANPDLNAVDDVALTALCDEIASVTLAHLIANGLVTVPPGVAVQVVPATGTGATTAPGLGAIS